MTQKDVIKLFKRFFLVFLLIGLPTVVVFTLVVKLKSIFVILITIGLVGAVFTVEEYIVHKKQQKRIERRKKEGKM